MRRKMRIASGGLLVATFLCYLIRFAAATVILKPISASFPDLPARFAAALDKYGVCGALYVADPLDGCSLMQVGAVSNRTERRTKFALIIRGECSFDKKILNAQNSGFQAAIVYDDKVNEDLVYMVVNSRGLTVPAVFVSKEAGEVLSKNAEGEDGECCIYPPSDGKAWTVLAISFFSLILIISFLLIAFFAPRNWARWRWRNDCPKSIDSKLVEALPCITFRVSSQCHTRETCAICLEDYRDGESLRLLPCQHDFHSSCVDSWLTKWGTSCPVCKKDIRTRATGSEVDR